MAMSKSVNKLDRVFANTHREPEAFTKMVGSKAADKFVDLFEKTLCDGMELPISEASDSLEKIMTVCETQEFNTYQLRGGLRMSDPEVTRKAQLLVVKIIALAQRLEQDSIDPLNDKMNFIRGMGNVAHEFCGKSEEYFNTGPSMILYLNRVVDALKRHNESPHDEDPADAGKILNELIVGSIKFSGSMKIASEHLEVLERDIGRRED